MGFPFRPQKVSRIHRHNFLQTDLPSTEYAGDHSTSTESVPELSNHAMIELREPLLIREKRGRKYMDEKHRMLHHRQVTRDTVVVVSVVLEVDSSGSTIALNTLPAVPTVPPFPSDLTVPAVPQVTSVDFPSVPAYPFGSTTTSSIGASSILSTALLSSFVASTSLAMNATITTSPTLTSSGSLVAPSTNSNQTISKANINSSLLLSLSDGLLSTSRSSSSDLDLSSTFSNSESKSASPAQSSADGNGNSGNGGNYGTVASAAPSSAATGAASNDGSSNGDNTSSTATVVGGVVGGLAGVALLLAIVLLLLRWYKNQRKGGSQRLEDESFSAPTSRSIEPAPQSMQQRSSLLPISAAAFLKRFSASSKGSDLPSPTQERGFQRISGRKLPSAFSAGITEEDIHGHRPTPSEMSFYRDDHGVYGGVGVNAVAQGRAEKETMMPSPARTPTVHQPYTFTPPRTPNPDVPPAVGPGTLGRSLPSHDGSRNSKFTEDV